MTETPRTWTRERPVSSLIARWENMRKLVETWEPPYHWPSVEEFVTSITRIERELDDVCPGWHEPWAGALLRSADWMANARRRRTAHTWILTHGYGVIEPTLNAGERVEVIEKASVDAERERTLDLLKHGRLPKEEG